MGVFKRVAQLGVDSAISCARLKRFNASRGYVAAAAAAMRQLDRFAMKFGGGGGRGGSVSTNSNPSINRYDCRQISQFVNNPPNPKRQFVAIDTLPVVSKLEAQGFSAKEAEAITASVTEIIEAHLSVSKEEMQEVKNLEAQGFPSKKAKAIKDAITELFDKRWAHSSVLKEEMEKEAHFSALRSTIGKPQRYSGFDNLRDVGYRASEDRFPQLQKEFRDEVRKLHNVFHIIDACWIVILLACVIKKL